jgi:hypothetical protein
MTLADLPVLNPSTPGKERRRAVVVAALFAVFGALYALVRSAAAAPPDVSSAVQDPVFGFAFPRGWGVAQAMWSGSATWPSRLAAADVGGTLALLAVVILAIALVVVMHPDILSRQGPQYVSPGRRITTVMVAFGLAFMMYYAVGRIDDIFQSRATTLLNPGRKLVGYAALFAIVFGGVWSFVGPKDFGRRVPLRISHGALGGLGVWAAITFATMLSSAPRGFLSSSLDTFYTLLTLDAASGNPGATQGWAISTDLLTAAVAMAVAGSLLVVTAPQSLGPGLRRSAALIAGIIFAFLAVVGLTTSSQTTARRRAVNYDVVSALQLDTQAPSRLGIILTGQNRLQQGRAPRMPISPRATADDCRHGGADQTLPAATTQNIQKLTAWLDSHGSEVSAAAIRVASCRAALQALRWDIDAARAGIFASPRPERIGPLTYVLSLPNIAAASPAQLRHLLTALADTARYEHGSDAAQHFADLARIAGDGAMESEWRQRIIQPTASALTSMLARPAYTDGTISGRIGSSKRGWRVGLLAAPEPSADMDVAAVPRGEGAVFAALVTSTDAGADGRFTFSGLRDGYYMLALLGPENSGAEELHGLQIRGDPGTIHLEAAHKTKDVGTISVEY